MSDDVRLDLLKEAIAKSDLDGRTKDCLADDLKYAQDINGTQDAALQGIKRLVISGVRRELIAHQRVSDAIKAHHALCCKQRGGDSIGVRGMQVCGKAALIVAAGLALALIVLAATGRFPW